MLIEACALLLATTGSPSTLLPTVAVLVKLPSSIGRLTVIGTLTVSPCSNWPPVCVQVTVAAATTQLKLALPALTLAVTALMVVSPAM